MKNILYITLLPFFFISCEDRFGMGVNTNKVEMIFSDASVTNFSQTSGLAKSNNSLMDYLTPKAVAGGGNISCLVGEPVSFTMDVFGNTLDIDTTCSKDIDDNIRISLLESMADTRVRRTVTGDFYNARDVNLNFGNISGLWNSELTTARNGGSPCVVKYKFNKSTGTVLVSAQDQSSQVSDRTGQNCGGAFSKNISFRFSNGHLELDLSNTKNFSPLNVYTDENGNLAPSYERFEVCGTELSSDTLPMNIGDGAINLDSIRTSSDVDLGGNIDCSIIPAPILL